MNRKYGTPNLRPIWLLLFIFLPLGLYSCTQPAPAANAKAFQQQLGASLTPTSSAQIYMPEQPVTATPLPTSPPPRRPIFIVDHSDQSLLSNIFMIDQDTQRVVWSIQTRFLPEVVLSPDNQRLYVADSYYSQVTRGTPHDVLSVFDAHSGNLLIDDIPIQGRLLYKGWPLTREAFMFFSDDGQQLYVEKYGNPDIHQLRLAAYSATTPQLVYEGLLPACDHRIVTLSDHWVCINGINLFEFNPLSEGGGYKTLLTMPGASVVSVAYDAQLNRLYTLDAYATVNVVDMQDNTIIETKRLEVASGWQLARDIKLAPDGRRLYVSLNSNANQGGLFSDAIAIYDTENWKPIAMITFASPVFHFDLSVAGDQLYATSPNTRSLTIYETVSFQPIAIINNLGGTPTLILVPQPGH